MAQLKMRQALNVRRLRLLAALFSLVAPAAHAADLDGIWASDKRVCEKVFVREGQSINFTPTADLHGSGFIIQGAQIRGKTTRCTIKRSKTDGAVVHLLASCANDVMMSDTQFSLEIVDKDHISRIYPGIPEMRTEYFRCSF